MKDENSSGGKATLGETESQMPHQNDRKHNLMAGTPKGTPSGTAECGYTKEGKIGGGSAKHDLKLKP